jgi:hypothetical protein
VDDESDEHGGCVPPGVPRIAFFLSPNIGARFFFFFLLLSPLPQKNRRTGVSNGQEHEQPQGAGQSDISETGFGWFGVVCQWYIDFLYLFGISVSPPLVLL